MSTINGIGLELLIKTHLAKQVVFRGVAIFLTHGLHRFFSANSTFLRVLDRHHGLHGFHAYLRPQQIVVETACHCWDYLVLKYTSTTFGPPPSTTTKFTTTALLKRIIPSSGIFRSPAHCVAFSDSASQVFFPTQVRWLMTFFVLSADEINQGLVERTAVEANCTSFMQCLRSFGHKTIFSIERKLSNRTPRTWKSLIVGQLIEFSLDYANCRLLNFAFFKAPLFMRDNPYKFYALRFSILIITYSVLGGAATVFNHTLMTPVWIKLQDHHEADPPPLKPASTYLELDTWTWIELGYFLEDTRRMVSMLEMSHNDRVSLLMELERITGYMDSVQRRIIKRTGTTMNSSYVSNQPSPPSPGNSSPPTTVLGGAAGGHLPTRYPFAKKDMVFSAQLLNLPDEKGKQCADCKQVFSMEKDSGQRVIQFACDHLICTECDAKYELDCCADCGAPLEDVTDIERKLLWDRHMARSSKMLSTRMRTRQLLPQDTLYRSWQEVAHVAIELGHIHRITAYNVPPDVRYCLVDTWKETLLSWVVAMFDVEPVTEEGNLCSMPFLWRGGPER